MFFSKRLLKEANDAAHREKRSRCIDPKLINNIPIDFICFIKRKFFHKKNEVRLEVIIDKNGITKFIDISFTRYSTLPTREYLIDGKFEDFYPERPYPNNREWKEVEYKKPIRKQNKFRKEILAKYRNSCAVCNIEETSLLVAAHILDVKDGGLEIISNGISLCGNHERAFDKGIFKILPNYEVIAPKGIGIEVKKIKLPLDKEDYPSSEYLQQKIDLLSLNNQTK